MSDIIDDLLGTKSKKAPAKSDNGVRAKLYQAAQEARRRKVNISDDDVEDYYNLIKIESGRAHYWPGTNIVKRGIPTANGDRAIGGSQIMPGTAKPYEAEGLDPFNEQDNWQMGLREFVAGDPVDPVVRRLRYVGARNNIIGYYRRTGEVPNIRLYSYRPDLKETYRSYVEKTGGFARPPARPMPSGIPFGIASANDLIQDVMAGARPQDGPATGSDLVGDVLGGQPEPGQPAGEVPEILVPERIPETMPGANVAPEDPPEVDPIVNLTKQRDDLQIQLKKTKDRVERRRISDAIRKITEQLVQLNAQKKTIGASRQITPGGPQSGNGRTASVALPGTALTNQKNQTPNSPESTPFSAPIPTTFERNKVPTFDFERSGKLGDHEYVGTAGGKHYFKDADGDLLEGQIEGEKVRLVPTGPPKRIQDGNKAEYIRADGPDGQKGVKAGTRYTREVAGNPVNFIVDGTKIAEENPKLRFMEKDGSEVVQTDDKDVPPGFIRLKNSKTGKTYLAKPNGEKFEIRRELPAWVLGKTKPKSVLPDDPALKASYQSYLKTYGFTDSEELRRKFIDGHQAVKDGKQTGVFTPDDNALFAELDVAIANRPKQAKRRGPGAGVPRVARNSPSDEVQKQATDLERTDQIKTADGRVLTHTPDTAGLKQGEIRVMDDQGETYIANPVTKDIRPESLASLATHETRIELIPERLKNSTTDEAAKLLLSHQVAITLKGAVAGDPELFREVPESDIRAFYQATGFRKLDTGKNYSHEDYFAKGDKATEPFDITRGDLKDLQAFSSKRRKMLEDYALGIIASGQEFTPRDLAQFKENDFDPSALADRRYDELEMAKVKGGVSRKDFGRYLEEFQKQEGDAYLASLQAKAKVGWLPRAVAEKEAEAYRKLQSERRAQIQGGNQKVQASRATGFQELDLRPTDAAAAQNTANYMRRELELYGSITNRNRKMRELELAEEARKSRVAQMSWGDYIKGSAQGIIFGTVKSALSVAIASTYRGIALASKSIDDVLYGADNPRKKVSDYATFGIAERGEQFLNEWLPTDEDMEREFLAGKLPQGVGSSLGMMPGGFSKSPKLMIALLSSLQMGGDTYKEAIEFGASEDKAQLAGLLTAPLGITEIAGIGEALVRLNKGAGGTVWRKLFREAWREARKEAPEELVQEGTQTFSGNIVANLVYDPDRKADKDLADNMLVAGISAPLVSVAVTVLNTVRNRRRIKRAIEEEQANGVIIEHFGEGEIYAFGKKVKVTDKNRELIESYENSRNGIEEVQAEISALQDKADPKKGLSANRGVLKQIWKLRRELAALQQRQVVISKDIAEKSGISVPSKEKVGDVVIPRDEEILEAKPIEDEDRPDILIPLSPETPAPAAESAPVEAHPSGVSLVDDILGADNSAEAPVQAPEQARPAPTSPESDFTIQKQIVSTLIDESPRSAVLLTESGQGELINGPGAEKLIPVPVDEGVLFVNTEKAKEQLGLNSPEEIAAHVQEKGYSDMLGKVEDHTGDTATGDVVRTEDQTGRELSSSVITDPANIEEQKAQDAAHFPDEPVSQVVMPVSDAVKKREEEKTAEDTMRWIQEAKPSMPESPKEKFVSNLVTSQKPVQTDTGARNVFERFELPVKGERIAEVDLREKTHAAKPLKSLRTRILRKLGYHAQDLENVQPGDLDRIVRDKISKREYFRKSPKKVKPSVLESAVSVDVSRSTASILRKKQNRARLRWKGYEYEVTGKTRVKITHAPAGNVSGEIAGSFESEAFNANNERIAARKPARPSGRPGKAKSLWQFVQSSGGIRPDTDDAKRGRLGGELERISQKELGKIGLVNRNSRYNAEHMAEHAWEMGYLRDLWPDVQDRDPNVFLDLIEEDARGIRRYFVTEEGGEKDAAELVDDHQREEIQQEQLETILAGMNRAEFKKTYEIELFLTDDKAWPIFEDLELDGEISEEKQDDLVKLGYNYGLSEEETRSIINELLTHVARRGEAGPPEESSADALDGRPHAGRKDGPESIFNPDSEEILDETEPESDGVDLSFDFSDEENESDAEEDISFDFGENVAEPQKEAAAPGRIGEPAKEAEAAPALFSDLVDEDVKTAKTLPELFPESREASLVDDWGGRRASGMDQFAQSGAMRLALKQAVNQADKLAGIDREEAITLLEDLWNGIYAWWTVAPRSALSERAQTFYDEMAAESFGLTLRNEIDRLVEEAKTVDEPISPFRTEEGRQEMAKAAKDAQAEDGDLDLSGMGGLAIDQRAYFEQEKKAKKQKTEYGKKNTFVTEDKAEAARKLLREKLKGTQHNAGLDPDVAKAGIELAAYHIEAGARLFADYAKAMIEDLGAGVIPYLKSWYLAVQFDPETSHFTAGMNDIAAIDKALDQFSAETDKVVQATAEKPEIATEDAPATVDEIPAAPADQATQTLPPAGDTLFDMGGLDQEGLFAVGGPAAIGETPDNDAGKREQIARLKQNATDTERERNMNVFGPELGRLLIERKANPSTPHASRAAGIVLARRGDIEAKGRPALDLVGDVVAAIEEIGEAEMRGMPFEEFILQGGLFGATEFTSAQREVYDEIGAGRFEGFFNKRLDQLDAAKEYGDVASSTEDLARDSSERPGDEFRQELPNAESGRDGDSARTSSDRAGEQGSGSEGSDIVPGAGAAPGGTRGDIEVRESPPGDQASTSGDFDDGRGGPDSDSGLLFEYRPSDAVRAAAQRNSELGEKRRLQEEAESHELVLRDLDNIRATLPFLLPEQHEDVLFAENRLEEGEGVLFTNGTGTGKTYTGLGIAKRLHRQGKKSILIIAPNDKILEDWRTSAENVLINAKRLESTVDHGRDGTVLTTYANFRANNTLIERVWDAIIFDESHYLSQNKDGDETGAVQMLRAVALHDRGQWNYHAVKNAAELEQLEAAREEKEKASRQYRRTYSEADKGKYDEANAKYKRLLDALQPLQDAAYAEYDRRRETEARPKVVFLSATPFAYEKNIEYAEGYLFSYGPDVDTGGYNSGSSKDRFFMQHFGYRMRYNKLTKPDADVNTELMEQQFNSMLQKAGALRGRRLNIDVDYSRKFILAESAIGMKIDEGFQYIWDQSQNKALETIEQRRFWNLHEYARKRFNYLAKRFTLEAINARSVIPIVKAQLEAGRKVVVFHDYNKNEAIHPFDFGPDFNGVIRLDGEIYDVGDVYAKFTAARPDLVGLDLTTLVAPNEVFPAEFGDQVKMFNGTVPKMKRREAVADFNDDAGSTKILLSQSDAGREGISLHDTTGQYQRVLINLGLPVRPIAAIQTEGRIYRVGTKTNAIQLYITTGTNFEQYAFGTQISQRASTAENLALGEEARALRQAFIDGYQEAVTDYAPSENEGLGGKEGDRALAAAMTDYQKAIGFYFGKGKKTSRNKSAEGKDYYATPEPIGLKMVEWADQRLAEHTLEPSAGHGAIARWFRPDNRKTVIEPSQELAAQLSLVTDGRLERDIFENHHTGANKYHTIVMNPPFGSGGKTAVDHVAKAAKHLHNQGRIVALIPDGPAADKQLEKFLKSEDAKDLYKIGDIHLPGVAFKRAATQVRTHIIILEKQFFPEHVKQLPSGGGLDLSHFDDIKELFDYLEHVEVEPRIVTSEAGPVSITPSPAAAAMEGAEGAPAQTAGVGSDMFDAAEFDHTTNGNRIFVAKPKELLDKATFNTLRYTMAPRYGGYYSKFNKGGAVAGFHFSTAAERDAFIAEASMPTGMKAAILPGPAPTFYSQVEKVITDKMPKRAPADQVRGILKPEYGIKKEELDWLGIDDFLASKDAFSKDEVLDFVRSNNVQVEEVIKGGTFRTGDIFIKEWNSESTERNGRKGKLHYFQADITRPHPVYEEHGQKIRVGSIFEDGKIFEATSAQGVKQFHTFDEAKRYLNDGAEVRFMDEGLGNPFEASPTKYSDRVLPGGENYRELLLTLPTSESALTSDQLTRYQKLDAMDTGDVSIAQRQEWEMLANRKNLNSANDRIFQSKHFDEPNILAHIRFNDRTDADGKKTLFIEEIQSDWHQAGREQGYSPKGPQKQYFLRKPDGDIGQDFASKEEGEQFFDKNPHAGSLDSFINNETGVLDAPFKKSWHELAFKRALRYAAENGYGAVAWTTGETQNDRYDLSTQVKSLSYTYSDGQYGIKGVSLRGNPFDIGVYDEAGLAAAVGKELAEKIKTDREGGLLTKEYTGDNLKLEGSGMKGFYDKIIPNFVDKYTRKWDAKVTPAEINTNQYGVVQSGTGDFYIVGNDSKPIGEKSAARPYKIEENAEAAAKRMNTQKAHAVEITPEMQISVMQGQPLFATRLPGQKSYDEIVGASLGDLIAPMRVELDGPKSYRIKLNAEAAEFLRRVYQEIRFQQTKTQAFEVPFYALFDILKDTKSNREFTAKVIRFINDQAKEAQRLGYTTNEVLNIKNVADAIEIAAENGAGGFIFYVDDRFLPEEEFHRAGYMIFNAAISEDRFADNLNHHTAVEKYKQIYGAYLDQFPASVRDAVAWDETAAILARGGMEELGVSEDEAVEYLAGFFESIAKRLEEKGINVEQALKNYDAVREQHIREQIRRTTEEYRSRREKAGRPGRDSEQGGQKPQSPPGEDPGSPPGGAGGERFNLGPPVLKGPGIASLPETLRAHGYESDRKTYDIRSHDDVRRAVAEMADYANVAEIIYQKLLSGKDLSSVDTGLAIELVQRLQREARADLKAGKKDFYEAKKGQAAQIADILDEKLREAGRFIEAVKLMEPFSPDFIVETAKRRMQRFDPDAEMTPDLEAELLKMAEELEESKNAVDELTRKYGRLDRRFKKYRELDRVERQKRRRARRAKNRISRAKESIIKKLAEKESDIIDKFRDRFNPPTDMKAANMTAMKAADVTTAQNVGLTDEELNELAEFGALELARGMIKLEPEMFTLRLQEIFGAGIRPFADQIHARSYAKYKELLREENKKNALERLKSANPDLNDAEIDQLYTERKEKQKEARKIANAHLKQARAADPEATGKKSRAARRGSTSAGTSGTDTDPALTPLQQAIIDEAEKQDIDPILRETSLMLANPKTRDYNGIARVLNDRHGLTKEEADRMIGKGLAFVRDVKRVRAEKVQEARAEKEAELTDEARAEIDAAHARHRQAENELRKKLDALSRKPVGYMPRLRRIWKGLLISSYKTAFNNAISGGFTIGVRTATDTIDLFLRKAATKGKIKLGEDGLDPKLKFRDILALQAWRALRSRRMAEGILDRYAYQYEMMFGRYNADIEADVKHDQVDGNKALAKVDKGADAAFRGAEWFVDKVNIFNMVQEFHVRSIEFIRVMNRIAKEKGLDLNKIWSDRNIERYFTEEEIEQAVDAALQATYAVRPDPTTVVGKIASEYNNLMNRSVLAAFAPIEPAIFMSFMYNAGRFITDYNPFLHPLKNIVLVSAGKKSYSTKDAAKFGTGSVLFFLAMAGVRAFGGDDDRWYVWTIAGVPVDMRSYQPFTSFIYFADVINRAIEGRTPIESWKDIIEQSTGFTTRAVTGNAALEFFDIAADYFFRNKARTGERMAQLGKNQLGGIVGAPFNFMRVAKDLVAAFDEQESVEYDYLDSPVLGQVHRRLPFSSHFWQFAPRKDYVTGQIIHRRLPSLGLFGVTAYADNYRQQTVAEEAAYAMREPKERENTRLPDEQRRADALRSIARAQEKGIDTTEAINRAVAEGLTTEKLGEILLNNKGKIPVIIAIERNRLQLDEIKRLLPLANAEEKPVIEALIAGKEKKTEESKAKDAKKDLITETIRELGKLERDKQGTLTPTAHKTMSDRLQKMLGEGKITELDVKEITRAINQGKTPELLSLDDVSGNNFIEQLQAQLKTATPAEKEKLFARLRQKWQKARSSENKAIYDAEMKKLGVPAIPPPPTGKTKLGDFEQPLIPRRISPEFIKDILASLPHSRRWDNQRESENVDDQRADSLIQQMVWAMDEEDEVTIGEIKRKMMKVPTDDQQRGYIRQFDPKFADTLKWIANQPRASQNIEDRRQMADPPPPTVLEYMIDWITRQRNEPIDQ
jgi:hypothetical protein